MQINIIQVKHTLKNAIAYNMSCLFTTLKDKREKPYSLIKANGNDRIQMQVWKH